MYFVGKINEIKLIKMSIECENVGLNAKFIPKCGCICLLNRVTQYWTKIIQKRILCHYFLKKSVYKVVITKKCVCSEKFK